MPAIPLSHDYDDEDTREYEYKPQTWQEAHRRRIAAEFDAAIRSAEEAERLYQAFIQGEIVLTSEEGIALYERVYGEKQRALVHEPEPPELRTEYSMVGWRSLRRTVARWLRRQADRVYEEAG